MRMKCLVSVGLVAALAVACKKEAKDAGGTAATGTGSGSSALGSAEGSARGSAAAATPTPAGSVTLKYVVDPVGAKWTETEHQRMELDIEAKGEKAQMVQEKTKTKQTEVLVASAVAVTKAKITYVDLVEKQTLGDKAKEKPAPHEGKSYILEADPSGTVKVTAADGSPVSAEEEAMVKEDEDSFGKPEKMGKALDGMTFEIGKRVEIPAERAKGAFGDDDKMKLDTLALTLTKVEGNDAWFDMEMMASGESAKGAVLKMSVKGPVHVNLTISKPLEMTLEGTVEMSGAATAKGTMKMSGKRTKG